MWWPSSIFDERKTGGDGCVLRSIEATSAAPPLLLHLLLPRTLSQVRKVAEIPRGLWSYLPACGSVQLEHVAAPPLLWSFWAVPPRCKSGNKPKNQAVPLPQEALTRPAAMRHVPSRCRALLGPAGMAAVHRPHHLPDGVRDSQRLALYCLRSITDISICSNTKCAFIASYLVA